MIKLEIELSELDYPALADKLLPMAGEAVGKKNRFLGKIAGSRAAGWLATRYINHSSQENLEGKTVALLNSQENRIRSVIEDKISELGINVKVSAIRAVAESDDGTNRENNTGAGDTLVKSVNRCAETEE